MKFTQRQVRVAVQRHDGTMVPRSARVASVLRSTGETTLLVRSRELVLLYANFHKLLEDQATPKMRNTPGASTYCCRPMP